MAASEAGGPRHLALRLHCGICSSPMRVTERFVLLIGNADSKSFSHSAGPFSYPDYGHRPPHVSGYSLCRKPTCGCSVRYPEASTVHLDCYQVFEKRCDVPRYQDSLWLHTAWRKPWRQAPHSRLRDPVPLPDLTLFDKVGLSGLRLLPTTLVHLIYGYSKDALLWRLNAALRFSERVYASTPDDGHSMPFLTIPEWDRDVTSTTTVPTQQLPALYTIRLTIDALGLRKIETLPDFPTFESWRTDDLVFVVMCHTAFRNVLAHFKNGLVRLELSPEDRRGFGTWDTPTPPKTELTSCRIFPPRSVTDATPLRTVNLNQTTGITLFFSHGQIWALHAHTHEAPCASSTFERFSRRRQSSVTWVYIPITSADYIMAFGVRAVLSQGKLTGGTPLLFRKKLTGDVSAGITTLHDGRDLWLSESPHSILIYDDLDLEPLRVIGAYTDRDPEVSNPRTLFSHPRYFDSEPPIHNASHSAAKLQNVCGMSTFTSAETGLCMGVLLDYKNGGQRALGQCRIGVDEVEYIANPARICFCDRSHLRPGTKVELQGTELTGNKTSEHDHDGQDWGCFAFGGHIEFWFSPEQTDLRAVLNDCW